MHTLRRFVLGLSWREWWSLPHYHTYRGTVCSPTRPWCLCTVARATFLLPGTSHRLDVGQRAGSESHMWMKVRKECSLRTHKYLARHRSRRRSSLFCYFFTLSFGGPPLTSQFSRDPAVNPSFPEVRVVTPLGVCCIPLESLTPALGFTRLHKGRVWVAGSEPLRWSP